MTDALANRPRTLRQHNGAKVQPTFSPEEMARRVAGLRAEMAAANLDAVVLTSIHNVNYFADFVYCSFGRPYALVVTADTHTTVSAGIDYGQPWRQSYDDNITYTDWHKGNFFIAIKDLCPARGRVGVEHDHLTLSMSRSLAEALPDVEWHDVAPATMRLRMVKSAEEHAIIRDGATVSDIGGAACREASAAGVPEYEVAQAATLAMVREIARRYPHTELMDTWTWFQSGLNTDGAHNPVTTRALQRGDILSLNCFSMISGYYQALERTAFVGHVDDASLRMWEVNCQVHRRGLELIKPGAVCSEIAAELNTIYAEHGLLHRRTFGYGHSFGTLCHYYGREAGLELREDIDTVVEPGMVVSMEPMITIPDGQPGAGGYREHDILIVGEDGAQNVTAFPFGPEHNIW